MHKPLCFCNFVLISKCFTGEKFIILRKKELAKIIANAGFEIYDVQKHIVVNSSLSFILNDELTETGYKLEGLLPDGYETEYRYPSGNTVFIKRKLNPYQQRKMFMI